MTAPIRDEPFCPIASTPEMRARIRELATENDDFDRAVLIVLNDCERLITAAELRRLHEQPGGGATPAVGRAEQRINFAVGNAAADDQSCTHASVRAAAAIMDATRPVFAAQAKAVLRAYHLAQRHDGSFTEGERIALSAAANRAAQVGHK